MKSYNLEKYINAGCPEVLDQIGVYLHVHTGGMICDTGCNRFNDGACQAYKNLVFEKALPVITEKAETVREEAKRRGISIKKVRVQRRDNS